MSSAEKRDGGRPGAIARGAKERRPYERRPDERRPDEQRPEARYPIRLVVLDLDGTLIGEDRPIGPRTRAAIARALAAGVHVAIATGRMPTSAAVYAIELGLTLPVLAYQGALVRNMPEPGRRLGRIVSHRPIPAAVAREVVEWTRARGLDPHLNHLERFIIRADDPQAADYSRFLGSRAELVPDLMAAIVHPVTKVLAVGEPALVEKLLAEARIAFDGRAAATISHPRFLEFIASGVSKGRAVRWLARRLGVPLEQTMAIGDQHNDLEMIGAVGHGVAMPTAPAEVLAVARHVAPPLEDEGAAQMVERLVLSGREGTTRGAGKRGDGGRTAEPHDDEDTAGAA
ncbi:MAG TPA: Cof-type HAD-IIB family hydrolase [Candidatus Acidoferrum sp.]|nr:Cof-type HAD-IIB family hydrolase [Candidatus Acidoferrum sp.]